NSALAAASKSATLLKIAAVSINEKKNYIFSTQGNLPATDILKHYTNVEVALHKIDKSVLHIKGDKKWFKLIIYRLSTNNYDDLKEAITHLRTEIESYNLTVTLFNNLR